MPHVGERLLVHLLVLEDRPERLGAAEQRVIVTLEIGVRDRLVDQPIGRGRIRADRLARRPRRIAARDRRGLRLRIDAAREDLLEMRVDAGAAERPS